jgi:hypothetical protein
LEEALSQTHRSLQVKKTSMTFQNLSKLYAQKGLNEEALLYQVQAYQFYMNVNEVDFDFLVLEI